jgi:hypothetical protein
MSFTLKPRMYHGTQHTVAFIATVCLASWHACGSG